MSSPFFINSPTSISFSGGRTSAYMLWRVLQENGGKLPDETIVCFANTGKEEEATLEFVRDCALHWNVSIVWLEYDLDDDGSAYAKVVNFETASRNGEPYMKLIRKRNYLPNAVSRFCTVELKIRTIHRYIKKHLQWEEWDSMLGIRADEPRRVARIAVNDETKYETKFAPLAKEGVTARDVGEFWRNQPFDLGLPNMNGKTIHGNCDLCFLKGPKTLATLIKEKPSRANWWAEAEAEPLASKPQGARFRLDRPSYADMKRIAIEQIDMFADEPAIECFCGD